MRSRHFSLAPPTRACRTLSRSHPSSASSSALRAPRNSHLKFLPENSSGMPPTSQSLDMSKAYSSLRTVASCCGGEGPAGEAVAASPCLQTRAMAAERPRMRCCHMCCSCCCVLEGKRDQNSSNSSDDSGRTAASEGPWSKQRHAAPPAQQQVKFSCQSILQNEIFTYHTSLGYSKQLMN